ncbi:hypothetical protein DDB_G0278029 [Dictyostelium discoideum AX4]|uniref:Uncharacterized protein n=1 Tax=Dictyostelium discoideum TaxID=44689 RepID=Q54YX4_DICDI|nr:hypothetical protein DDB_G0278029 [Dictyostelium discoideum AX4]EAL68187.1 hypothetical protein DDB_G0278029 [Dictyostelium discoideum AX4]|eukprot:XP_642078.1 hypothetical protein DDB_G0278029 [Dictyostelium discoideum AX4]
MALLPIYIQKEIIQIYCLHYFNVKKILNHKEKRRYNKILVNLSLVCWSYHQTLSNYLYCIQDFNFEPWGESFFPPPPLTTKTVYISTSKYSIYKFENITTLKLHHREYRYKQENAEAMISHVNLLISKFTNLQNVSIDIEHNNVSNALNSLEFVNKLKLPPSTTIEIRKISCQYMKKITNPNLKFINNVLINQSKPFLRKINHLENYYNDNNKKLIIRGIKAQKYPNVTDEYYLDLEMDINSNGISNTCTYVSPSHERFSFTWSLFLNNFSNHKIFSNLTSIRAKHLDIPNLLRLLENFPLLNEISISVCYSDIKNNLKLSEPTSPPPTDDLPSTKCLCSIYNSRECDEIEFNSIWKSLIESLRNHKNLKSLSVKNECLSDNIRSYLDDIKYNLELPIFLNQLLNKLPESVKYLEIHNPEDWLILKGIVDSNPYISHYTIIQHEWLTTNQFQELCINNSNILSMKVFQKHDKENQIFSYQK